jgi:hypothetical protein
MSSVCTLCLRRFRGPRRVRCGLVFGPLPGPRRHPAGSGTLRTSEEACQSGRMGLTANELSSLPGTGGSNPLASAATTEHAPVAQRIEHLTTDQKVGGSNPFGRAPAPPALPGETAGLRHGHGCIPINGSLVTAATRITIVTSASCGRQCDVSHSKGVTCRRFLESCRYRWRRRPLSDSSLRWASRHRCPPRLVARPKRTSTPLPQPQRRHRRSPHPRRLPGRRLGAGHAVRMSMRRYPGWAR